MTQESKSRKRKRDTQCPYWSLTINKWDVDLSKVYVGKHYFVSGQFEVAPTTGHLHLQLFLYQRNWKDFETTIEWVNETFKCKGPQLRQCEDLDDGRYIYFMYTNKEATRAPNTEHIFLGGAYDKLPQEFLQPYYHKYVDLDIVDYDKCVSAIISRKKIGKSTRLAKIIGEYLGPNSIYLVPSPAKNQKGRWLGDYKGQPIVVLEEFLESDFTPNYWKQFMDRTPQSLASSQGGKSVLFAPSLIFMFANVENPGASDDDLLAKCQQQFSWLKKYPERLTTCQLSFLFPSPLYVKNCVFNF